jgi:fatty acid-binding protein DegV
MAMVVGSLLQIKPIISVLDVEVKNIGKTMGLKKGFNQLIDMVNGLGGINFDYPYGIIYSGNDKTNLEKFLLNAKELWEQDTLEPFKSQLGSTIGTHIGPGAIGIAFFTK